MIHQFLDLADRARVNERVVHHNWQAARLGRLNQPQSLRGTGGNRLFDDHVFARLKSQHGQLEVGVYRGRDHDHIDAWVPHYLQIIGSSADGGVTALGQGQAFRPKVADGNDPGPFGFRDIADQVRSPVTVSDDPKTYHGFHSFKLV